MSALVPYLIVALVSLWAVVGTALAVLRGRTAEEALQAHADSEARIERYRAALLQLKSQAETLRRELDRLQRDYAELQAAAESQEASAPGEERTLPMLMLDHLDLSAEVGTLLEHVARVAVAVRNFSAYTRGHQGSEQAKARYDLLWLADCLHSFDQLGRALAAGSPRALARACEDLVAMYDRYLKDNSGYNSRDTFQRLAGEVPLGEASEAIKSILAKTAQTRMDPLAAAKRDHEVDQIVSSVLH